MKWWYELPLRFQFPRCVIVSNVTRFDTVTLEPSGGPGPQFIQWFQEALERDGLLKGLEPIASRVSEDGKSVNVKIVDGFTQYFDRSDKFLGLTRPSTLVAGTTIDCIVEIDRVYGPMKDNGVYGITCKAFQVRIVEEEGCLFQDS